MASSFMYYRERSRDVQDHIERHIWGERIYTQAAGSYMKTARGTDTNDEEVTIIDAGQSFNLKKDSNSEIFFVASSSDTNLKLALLSIPRDKQRRWKEEHGGIQNPLDPEFALDISKELAHITKHFFGVGKDGEFEVKKKEAYFRVDKLIVDGELIVNKQVKTPKIVEGSEKPPGFKGNEQAEVNDKDDSGSKSTA